MTRFEPNPRYATKLRLIATLIGAAILICVVLLATLLRLDREISVRGAAIMVIVTVLLDVMWWLPAVFLAGPYCRSLKYEIQEEEVIVRGGIWTRTVKHVPYRTVTNLTVKRGLLDRWLGLGTLDIQTAGMSGTSSAEQSLAGLENAQEAYALVAAELRRFRGNMAPTAAEIEDEAVPSAEVLRAILADVRAIREALERRT
jgi:uncharacterized membrane protein YdbT with pleckstrin-like domain